MPSILNSRMRSLLLAFAATSFSIPAVAQGLPGDAGNRLIEFSGAMHSTAEVCGDYSAEQLTRMKAEQKATYAQQGWDTTSFNKAFAKGEADGKQRWGAMSKAQQVAVCKDIKGQMSAASDYYSN